MKLRLAILIAVVGLVGCESDRRLNIREENRQMLIRAWDACLEKGGVPIRDDWWGAPVMDTCEGARDDLLKEGE